MPEDTLTVVDLFAGAGGLLTPFVVDYHGNSDAQPVDEPLGAIETKERFTLVVPECWSCGLDVRYRMLQTHELKQAQCFPAPGYSPSCRKSILPHSRLAVGPIRVNVPSRDRTNRDGELQSSQIASRRSFCPWSPGRTASRQIATRVISISRVLLPVDYRILSSGGSGISQNGGESGGD